MSIKSTVLACAIVGFAASARLDNLYLPPQGASARASSGYDGSGSTRPRVPIVRFDANNEGDGSYRYAYESGNGIAAQEEGSALGDGTNARGSYSYTAPDGQKVSITYTADENGFVAQGSHIPTPPPVPAEIQRAIEQNLADEARGLVDDGSYRAGDEGQYNARYDGQGGSQGGAGAGAGNGGYRY